MYLSISGWVTSLMLLFSALMARGQSDSMGVVRDNTGCNEYCCFTETAPVGMMYTHLHPKGQWMLSYRYMYMSMGEMYDGNEKISNEEILNSYIMSSSHMNMQMHMFMAMYGLSERITLMAMLNYNRNEMTMAVASNGHHHGGAGPVSNKLITNGFGDTKIAAMVGLIDQQQHCLLFIGGVSIPSGSIQQEGGSGEMYEGERLPYAMQLGSGTWDFLPGINYEYKKGSFSYDAQILSTLRTGYNRVGYRLGNDLTLNNWVAYQWTNSFSTSARLEGYTAGSLSGADPDLYAWYEPAANPANYGGSRLSAYAGVNYGIRTGALRNHKLGAEFGIPLYQYLNGPQQATKATLYASWLVVF